LTMYREKVYNVNQINEVCDKHMVATVATLSRMPRKPLDPSEKKVGLAARVDPQLLVALQRMATADDRTLSYMVEKAIRDFVERHGDARAKPKGHK
jgi:predicted HicB family RNase H-like nuclease